MRAIRGEGPSRRTGCHCWACLWVDCSWFLFWRWCMAQHGCHTVRHVPGHGCVLPLGCGSRVGWRGGGHRREVRGFFASPRLSPSFQSWLVASGSSPGAGALTGFSLLGALPPLSVPLLLHLTLVPMGLGPDLGGLSGRSQLRFPGLQPLCAQHKSAPLLFPLGEVSGLLARQQLPADLFLNFTSLQCLPPTRNSMGESLCFNVPAQPPPPGCA